MIKKKYFMYFASFFVLMSHVSFAVNLDNINDIEADATAAENAIAVCSTNDGTIIFCCTDPTDKDIHSQDYNATLDTWGNDQEIDESRNYLIHNPVIIMNSEGESIVTYLKGITSVIHSFNAQRRLDTEPTSLWTNLNTIQQIRMIHI